MSKVLIADDDRLSCKLLGSLLAKWGYEPEIVYNGVDAQRELLKPEAPQLAILDWVMPGLDGIQVIKSLRATRRPSYTYVLLLTSKAQKEDLLLGLDTGADDYLKKPFDAPELRARLGVGARILGLETRLATALETTEYRTTHDALTGLYNRSTIIELLSQEASRCAREGQKVSLLLVDVDRFRTINETHGPLVGDQVIKLLAPRMASPLRPHDLVGRFGGEQFLTVAPNCPLGHAMVVADRIRLSVAKEKVAVGKLAIPVTVSVGVSGMKEGVPDINQALRSAELALFEAKKNGRNRVECSAAPEQAAGAASSS